MQASSPSGLAQDDLTHRSTLAPASRRPTSTPARRTRPTSRSTDPCHRNERGVGLSDSRSVGDDIQIDFEFTGTSMNYPVEGTELQLDAGSPGESYWNGTATLENRDGARG